MRTQEEPKEDAPKGGFWRDFRRRRGWLALSLALHACLLALLFAPRWRVAVEQPAAPVFIVEAWGEPSPAPAPSPVKEETIEATEVADAPPEVEVAEVVEAPIEADSPPETIAGDAAGAVASCDLANAVRATLQADAGALAAVARLPRDARSAANAVMLWDGAWLDAPGAPAAVSAVQRAVGDLVNAASAECRSKAMTGPQFIILDDARGATVLVIGSGAWRWGDLIDLQRAESI